MTADEDGSLSRRLRFETSLAYAARVYDYWLGGKDNFAIDRVVAEKAIQAYPGIVAAARANRAFLARAVRYLAGTAGIRQFLDVGSGFPALDNTHEVAQSVSPDCRVVYVDHDPVVITHARALLTSTPQGAANCLEADLRSPGDILPRAARTLDFRRPVALMLLSTLHLVPDEDDPFAAVRRLISALAPGSYLVVSHGASDLDGGVAAKMAASVNGLAVAHDVTVRSREEVARFFDGMDLIDPGLVRVSQWRPDCELRGSVRAAMWAGVAVRP